MTRRTLFVGILLFLIPLAFGKLDARPSATPGAQTAAGRAVQVPRRPLGPPASPGGLAALFKPGRVFQDRNGDSVVDFVDCSIILSDRPQPAERAAAANIAARLGFETTALNLPIPASAGASRALAIFVGSGSLARAEVMTKAELSVNSLTASPLKAGEGLIASFAVRSGPALAVLGDEDGVASAGMMLAGHLPFLWDQKGPTLDSISDDVGQFLSTRGIKPVSAAVASISVRNNVEGTDQLVVEVQYDTGGDIIKAEAALNQFKATAPRDARRPLSYRQVRTLVIRLRTAESRAIDIDLPSAPASAPGQQAPGPSRRPPGAKDAFDLSSFYSNEGALGDSDNNLIPDRTDVMLSADGNGTDGIVDLAARLGLESAGVTLPIAKPPAAITTPESEPILVLMGLAHPLMTRLNETHAWERPTLNPGDGLIQVVRKAFGDKSALVVTGGDAPGVERAVRQIAERFPYIWARGKDRTTLDDVEDGVRKFVGGRTPAGQAAMSLYKLEKIASDLQGKELASANVHVYVEKAADGLDAVVKQSAESAIKATSLKVDVQNLDVRKGRPIIEDEFDIPSEVEEFWTRLRTRVIPAVRRRQGVTIEARLSEPPELRADLERQARAELVKAGADDSSTSVTILSAYKQGFSWLYDVVRPALSGKGVGRITIKFAEIGPPSDWNQQGMFVPTRWLLELYPIDEILAQELHIETRQIVFEKAPIGSPAYEVVATSPDGAELLRKTFDPKFVERPFFDRFPYYERVRVTTGWLTARVANRTVIDERISTDPERFWDHFQSKTLPALYDHVMALGGGKPRPEDAPFFGELRVDLSLSEPDYRLPVDQEQISSMEAMHEEIYFNTIHFFEVMGRFTRGAPLTYPGRIIPLMYPRGDGKPGHARITATGFDAPRPSVVAEYVERNGRRGVVKLDVPRIAVDRPQALGALVRNGQDGIERLDLRLKVDSERDDRAELIQRADEFRVDRTMLSAEQVTAVFANLRKLRDAGLYKDALAYHDLRNLRVTAGWENESHPQTETVVTLEPNGTPAAFPDIRHYLPAGYRYQPGTPMTQWDTPIPPPEAYEELGKMSTFKEATVYKVGESYLGQEVWAMDLMPPIEATHWSQAKQTTMKPTIVYSARQHANEVSSTSHVLKLAELLLTDPAYREKLNRVNVVIHPITNADGAQLAYDLQKTNPNFMLHAGYLGALGVDVTTAQWDPDPLYPESGIRPKIWRTWLPDIFLNPHGYPSHEWVQPFSEYAAWVRTRAVETRDYWTMRGWWMPGFAWLDDPRYPRHKAEQMKLLDMITRYAREAPGTVTLNQRAYDRYKRYSFDFDQKNFKLDFTNGVLIYKSIKGARANPQATDFMTRNPNVTIWEGVTEAPDETARGDWMKLVANAGLQWDKAVLDYLVEGHHEVERKVEPFWGGVSLTLSRPRPPKMPDTATSKSSTAPGS